nr:hypothetical protein [Tanacetum cinerariifolium]
MADFGGSPKLELFVVHLGSVAARIKDRKCKTRRGSSRPPVKRKLAFGSSNSRVTHAKTSTSKDDVPFLTVSDDDEGNLLSFELFTIVFVASKVHPVFALFSGLSDAVVDNAVNRTSCELLEIIKKLKGECDLIKERERAREEVSENAEKARLEAVKVSLRKEVDDVKRDRMEAVSKVVPYAAMELIHNDDLGSLVGRLVSSAIFYRRCKAFEQVTAMKEPFDLSNVKRYCPSYKKEHDQAGNDLAITTFPWLLEFVADPQLLLRAHVWPYNILLNVRLGNMRLKCGLNILTYCQSFQ